MTLAFELYVWPWQAERSRSADKESIEAEALQYKLQLKDLTSQNEAFKKKM